jgi:four helix bundle protein
VGGVQWAVREELFMARNYQGLVVWQRAMDLVAEVYVASRSFPREEVYGLTSQLRRAAVSIPSNIAEGEGRGSKKEFVHFLRIAHGSLREVETQLIIAERLAYLEANVLSKLIAIAEETGRLINGLMNSLRRQSGEQS